MQVAVIASCEYAKNEEPGQPGQQPPKKRKGLVKTNLDSNVLGLVAMAVASLGMAVVVGKKRKNK
mgnify:CR=1 FL=1